MKSIMLSIIIMLIVSTPCIATKSIYYINNNDYEKAVELPYDQKAFFDQKASSNNVLHHAELILKLPKNIDAISPAIGQLKDLQTVVLIRLWDSGSKMSELTIPLELLNLPHLKTLKVYEMLSLRFPSGADASRIHSNIERLIILNSGKGTEPLPGLDRLHNLRDLYIDGSTTVALDDSLCGLSKLERLTLSTPLRSPLPRCLNRLTRLKSVTMTSCRQESLPDKTKIYFPVALASLPNLEELKLWNSVLIEMPKASYGFKKLRILTIDDYPNSDVFSLCPNTDGKVINFDGMNLDAVVDYPNLQKISVRGDGGFKGSRCNTSDCDPVRGIRRFMGVIDAAWKAGKLPSLKQIEMWDRDDDMGNIITVWKRPSSRDEDGTRLPRHDVNWTLKKERDKAAFNP